MIFHHISIAPCFHDSRRIRLLNRGYPYSSKFDDTLAIFQEHILELFFFCCIALAHVNMYGLQTHDKSDRNVDVIAVAPTRTFIFLSMACTLTSHSKIQNACLLSVVNAEGSRCPVGANRNVEVAEHPELLVRPHISHRPGAHPHGSKARGVAVDVGLNRVVVDSAHPPRTIGKRARPDLLAGWHTRERIAVLPNDGSLHTKGVLVDYNDLRIGVCLQVPCLQGGLKSPTIESNVNSPYRHVEHTRSNK